MSTVQIAVLTMAIALKSCNFENALSSALAQLLFIITMNYKDRKTKKRTRKSACLETFLFMELHIRYYTCVHKYLIPKMIV